MMFMRLFALVALSFTGLCSASATADIDAAFQRACAVSKIKGGPTLTNEQKLNFYALFKIATVGPLKEDSELPTDLFSGFKIEKWSQLTEEGMTPEVAKTQYIAMMDEIRPEWRTMRLK